jgi:hypothetical protein
MSPIGLLATSKIFRVKRDSGGSRIYRWGDGLGDEGEGAGGGIPLPPGVRGLGPRENFLQKDVENMHFRGRV